MQVGKTTAADHLVARHGFRKLALADPIKEIASRGFDWDGRKDARGRRLLQEIGTVGRRYHPDLWLERLAARLLADAAPRVVIDDLRLAREVAALERLGFTCIRLDRPGAPAPSAGAERHVHETEGELDVLDLPVIDNRGDFPALYEQVDALVARLERQA